MNIVGMVKENPLLVFIYRRLTSVLEIVPYYLVREYLFEESELNLKPELDGFKVDFLKSLDMKAISESSEVNDSEDILLKRLDNGCICLGIKHKEDIILNLVNFLFEYNHLRRHGGLNYETPFDKLQKLPNY